MNAVTATDKPSWLRRVARPFIAGALATLPLALTLAIILWLAGFIQRILGPGSLFGRLLEAIGLQFVPSKRVGYLIGLAGALVLIYLFGLLVESGMKNRWHALVDTIMKRVPLVNTIYDSSKKLIAVFDRDGTSEMKEMQPVMCYFGGKGGVAVLALMPNPDLIRLEERDYHAVLIPSAPVPFGGALLYVPAEWVEPANIPFDGLFNIYMSMGVTSKDYLQRRLAQKLPERPERSTER
jgi:uncharacterized membrane protein